MVKPAGAFATSQPVGHRRLRRKLGMQRLQGKFVEAVAQVFDDLLGLGRAAGIDTAPAVLRIEPDEGAAPAGEGARHQLLGDALAQFLQLLAPGRVALLFLDHQGPLASLVIDHRRWQQALFNGQRDQPLAVKREDQRPIRARRDPAAAQRLIARTA
jgi:hypothetical protein